VKAGTEELREELQRVLSLYFRRQKKIRRLRRRRSNYSSSHRIENLEVELDGGKNLSLVFKDMSASSLLETAQDVRPRFLYHPQREMETYRALLDPKQFGTAICYGTTQRPELERYWLFLERVSGPLLWQAGRIESWKCAAHWIANLHTRFSRNAGAQIKLPQFLLRHDQQYYLRWMQRAGDLISTRRASLGKELYQQFERLACNYDRVIGRLLSLPQTLIHGEFYPSNVILRRGTSAKSVCPIDWEVAAVGPGLIDLAALTSGNWTAQQKRILVQAYCDGLQSHHASASLEDMLEFVDYCQLHLAVQWLGWADDWTPPKTHAQDWLGEALKLSKHLGILVE